MIRLRRVAAGITVVVCLAGATTAAASAKRSPSTLPNGKYRATTVTPAAVPGGGGVSFTLTQWVGLGAWPEGA